MADFTCETVVTVSYSLVCVNITEKNITRLEFGGKDWSLGICVTILLTLKSRHFLEAFINTVKQGSLS